MRAHQATKPTDSGMASIVREALSNLPRPVTFQPQQQPVVVQMQQQQQKRLL